MTRHFFNTVMCDTTGGCPFGWDQEGLLGEQDETVDEMLRAAGWARSGGKHICVSCIDAKADAR